MLCLFVLLAVAAGCGEGPGEPPESQVLVRGNGGEPGTLDPVLAEDIHAFNVLLDMYEGLFIEDASGRLIPGVAESWQVSPDGRRYTFRLRDTARWSNGDAVLAQDFVRAIRRAADPESTAAYAFLLEPIENFATVKAGDLPADKLGVEALADDELEIRLAQPIGYLQAILALPIFYPAHVSGAADVSNGAYFLKERSAGGEIRLAENPYHPHSDATFFDEIHYLPIADPLAEFNMYRAGEIHVTHNVPDDMVPIASESHATQLRIAPSLALYYIAFDLTEPPFDDPPLREALSMVTDRDAITALLGRGEQAAYGIVPPGVAGYDAVQYAWAGHEPEARVAAARDLYAEAGYSDDNPLRITLMYDAGGVHEKIALAVSAMWHDALGADVQLERREWNYFLDSRDRREDWDAMRFAWFGDYNSAKTFLDIFRSDSDQNLARFRSATFDDLMDKADRASNTDAAAEAMREAERTVLDNHAVVPVYFFVSKHMVADSIGGFELNVVDRHASRWLYRK